MKKLLLVFMTFLLCTASLWAGTITIGTQVVQRGTSGIGPTNYYWESRRIQWVILASEITTAGGSGGNITAMAFDVSQIAGGNLANYTVKMGHTTAIDASSHNTATLTQVVNPHSFTPGATGWRTLTFNTPFPWDGLSNIVVDVCWGVNSGYGSNGQVWLYNNVANQMRGVYSGSANQCGNTTTTTRSGKPRIQLTLPTLSPSLSVVPSSIAFGYVPSGNTYEYPTPYVLSGSNLTAGPIVVTAPSAEFEVSLTGGGVGFGSSVNVTYTPPTLTATNIYV
ncbi:MAG: hypothetical protein FJY07_10790, partial [Bacteroidetes bacterium]|nr:hypothetical protein [Bacteroidota bacterium]